jgi:hypothetical protein
MMKCPMELLIPYNGVVNWDGVLKSSGRPKANHVTYL